jgi:hypothetical protein
MNALREIYDFITGSSVVTPIGLAVTIAATIAAKGVTGNVAAYIFVALILLTLAVASREKVT